MNTISGKYRQTLSDYYTNNGDISIEMSKYEYYLKFIFITLADNIDDIKVGYYKFWRLIQLIMVRLIVIGGVIIVAIVAYANDPGIQDFLFNLGDYFGNRLLGGTLLCLILISAILIEARLLYDELNGKLYLFIFSYKIKHAKFKYPLNRMDSSSLSIILSLVRKYFIIYVYLALVFSTFMIPSGVMLIELFKSPSYLKLVTMFIFEVCGLIIIIENYGMAFLSSIFIYLSVMYTRYKFLEIHRKIVACIKYRNRDLLFRVIEEHNYWANVTKDLNYNLKYFIFIIYYLWSIGIELCVYYVYKP